MIRLPKGRDATPGLVGKFPADDLLPDDWDKDLLEGIAPPPQTAPPATPAPADVAPSRMEAPGPQPTAAPAAVSESNPSGAPELQVAPVAGPPGTPRGPPRVPVRPSPGGGSRGPRGTNNRDETPARPTAKGADQTSDTLDAYLERLLKLIPTEVVSIYPVGRSLIGDDAQQGLWAVVCLGVCVLFRSRMTRGPNGRPQWTAVGIAAVSFVIWVYVLGAHVLGLSLPTEYKVWPALTLLAWTTVIPVFYTGSAAPGTPRQLAATLSK
jgi:hypothetical protein